MAKSKKKFGFGKSLLSVKSTAELQAEVQRTLDTPDPPMFSGGTHFCGEWNPPATVCGIPIEECRRNKHEHPR